jgi:hypothetical protein
MVIQQRHEIFCAVLHLISPEVIEQVISRFETEGRCIADALRILRAERSCPLHLLPSLCMFQRRFVDSKHELPVDLDRALQYTLQLVSGHSEFERHAFQACALITGALRSRSPSAVTAACKLALEWQPVRWSIPTETEISAVEDILYKPKCETTEGAGGKITEHFKFCCQFKWFFSAAAVALDYLETHAKQRAMMRHIFLVEDRMSVSNSERGRAPNACVSKEQSFMVT